MGSDGWTAPRTPAGVVFDCDGTLADTETLSDRAWDLTLSAYGYRPTLGDFQTVIGRTFQQNWAYYAERVDLGDASVFYDRLRTHFQALFDRELVLFDDAVATLRQCRAARIPVAVASSSRRGHVLRVLERGELVDDVAAVIGADDVDRHKPDPAPYLAAAAALRVPAAACTAVEDTSIGVAAAAAAGMFTVAVRRPHAAALDLSGAHRVVKEVSFDALRPPTEGDVGTRGRGLTSS